MFAEQECQKEAENWEKDLEKSSQEAARGEHFKRRQLGGGRDAIITHIQVVDGVVVDAWCSLPYGVWEGNEPTYLIGQKIEDLEGFRRYSIK